MFYAMTIKPSQGNLKGLVIIQLVFCDNRRFDIFAAEKAGGSSGGTMLDFQKFGVWVHEQVLKRKHPAARIACYAKISSIGSICLP